MRTERPNQLIGVLAHETGHIAGGHLARAQEELDKLSTLQILEAHPRRRRDGRRRRGGGGVGRPGPTGRRQDPACRARCLAFLNYTQTQENSADQAAITFLERTQQSPKGTIEFLRFLQREERMLIGRRDPYLSTHPLTPDRIAIFEEAAARSPYTNTPDSPQVSRHASSHGGQADGLHHAGKRPAALPEGDRSVPARYARAIALYRTGALGSALLTIDGLLKDIANDPYFHELRGQMLFENGRAAESVPSYRRAVQLLPGVGIVKIDFGRALLETNKPDNDREAVRNLELAAQTESGSFDLWRLMAVGYARLNNPGMTSLARAEMAILRGNRAEAQAHAAAAERQLQAGTPAWQRAQDIKAYINSRPRKK